MHLTLVSDPATFRLTADLVEAVRTALGAGPAAWLADGEAADLECGEFDAHAVANVLDGTPVDAIPTEGTRRKRLLVADMDSTIVTSETLDEIAAMAGIGTEVAAITRRSMNGEIDFAAALRERVAMLRGASTDVLARVWAQTTLTPGAAELVATMRAHGAVTALVSGGFTYFTSRVAARAGFDLHRANELLDRDGALTGAVAEPILDRDAKRATLLELAAAHGLRPEETLAVGDGANDLAMIAAAGMGVAFRAKPVVAAAAPIRVDSGLRALLFAQGYAAAEFVSPAAAA